MCYSDDVDLDDKIKILFDHTMVRAHSSVFQFFRTVANTSILSWRFGFEDRIIVIVDISGTLIS